MTTKLPLSLLTHYMAGVDFYFQDHEGEPPPSDLGAFRADAEETRRQAVEAGELDELRAVIDAVLVDESVLASKFDLTLAELINSENSQPEPYLRDVLAFYRSAMWPDAPPIRPGQPPDIELVLAPLADWRRERNRA